MWLGRVAKAVESARYRTEDPCEEGLFVKFWLKLALVGVTAATLSMVDEAVANADQHIDFGLDKAGCMRSASQANQSGFSAYCFETGPDHYALNVDDD